MKVVTTETKLFSFDELSEDAKLKALESESQAQAENFEPDYIYEDAKTIGELIGIQFDIRSKNNPKSPDVPCIYYRGFSSQGDGACFEGSYKYNPGSVKAIKSHAPNDKTLHGIVERLQAIQKKHFYKLRAKCKHSGHYYHSGCMQVEVYHYDDQYRDIGDSEEEIRQELREFAEWIYSQLEKEYDYQTGKENCTERLRDEGEIFTEEGEKH